MTKTQFILEVYEKLPYLPSKEIDERISFYIEIIDDRIEDGLSEEEAVSAVGSIDDIVSHIVAEVPLTKIVKERIKSKRKLKAWEIVLLALGSPIWVSIGLALFAVILSVYISLWSVLVSLWAVFVSLVCSAIGCVALGVFYACIKDVLLGLVAISAGLICAGFSIFMFYGCKVAIKGILILTKKFAIWLKNCFVRKEEA